MVDLNVSSINLAVCGLLGQDTCGSGMEVELTSNICSAFSIGSGVELTVSIVEADALQEENLGLKMRFAF
jgi:hypothetical protein